MTLQTHLQFGDVKSGIFNQDYLVVGYHHGFNRAYNSFSPANHMRCNDVEVTVIAPTKGDMSLYEWYTSNAKMSGRLLLEIMDIDASSGFVERSISFQDAQCVSLRETYDIHQRRRRQLTLTFTPAKIKVEEVNFTREKEESATISDDDDDVDMDKYNAKYDF